jgi:nitrous oxide reductase accessory protein NosL
MGPEAIPFSKKEDAEKFKAEHKAKTVAPFSMVTLTDLQAGKKKMLKMKHGH